MNASQLPDHPSLEQYKKQAKDLVKNRKSSDPESIQRIRQHHPRFDKLSDSDILNTRFVLADAQLVIAREHGFESWPRFAKHIGRITRGRLPAALWKSAEEALITGDVGTLERLLRENPELRKQRPPAYGSEPGRLAPNYSGADAQSIILHNHHFESWAGFSEYIDALKRNDSPIARFEAAVEAVIAGDVNTLERLLREHPDLIRARSTRKHHSTLLHYVGANGIEDFRQKTPKNAVQMAEILLDAGARVDAVADMYGGGCTALSLVATSIHPLLAGVQDALMGILIENGTTIQSPGAVNDCLANGRPGAAEFLAGRGAPLDLEGAAGIGRLDVVRSYFNEDGTLKMEATAAQKKDGFTWACEFGRTSVVDFLLEKGMEVGAKLKHHGQTGLHWAAYGGHLDTVKVLLKRKAPVNVTGESFGGTPLGWALYAWAEAEPGSVRDRYYEVVALLVAAGATEDPEWLADPDREMPLIDMVRSDPRMLVALNGACL